ncbi:hypothetical protein [Sphingobium sp. CCH11-B1]|uniref:hypothetical protein n=1 Tax=Sphingobium sp. CCH11-B1 TaxID=1768781 RepID=UPI000A7235BF|nr:hypothetical protein [Sphingobium sp. CCH11-B1]
MDRFKKDKNYAEAFKRRQRWQKLGGLKEEEKKGAGWSGLFLGLLAIIVIGALLNSVNSTSTDPRKAEEERRRRYEREERKKDIENLQRALCEAQPWLERCR